MRTVQLPTNAARILVSPRTQLGSHIGQWAFVLVALLVSLIGIARFMLTGTRPESGQILIPASLATLGAFLAMAVRLYGEAEQLRTVHAAAEMAQREFETMLARERQAIAAVDPLTGLPNREALLASLAHLLADPRRAAGAVAVLDLDRFGLINESAGPEAGDDVLRAVATRIGAPLGDSATTARIAGDRFALVLRGVTLAGARLTVERVLAAVAQPLEIAGQAVPVSASAGIAIWPAAPGEAREPIQDAETALAVARRLGPGSVQIFAATMATPAGRLALEAELREATVLGQFAVHYQPVVSLDACEVVEVEALVRWNHPERGLISPGEFIPLAEETGLIVPIGWLVLREACEQGALWNAKRPTRPLTIAVNLSPRAFREADLVPRVRATLAATNFPPACLRLEITEGVTFNCREEATERLRQLKAMGVQLAIDDFGTGYSSLAYLQQFPIDVIKIDRAFISTMAECRESAEIVRSIVSLARALDLETTGEGIETEGQLAQLREFGSDRAQGFLFARPMPAGAIEDVLAGKTPIEFAA
ncbi:MAG: EAL domain-containing protein [Chloroflexota bacterium]|nr:EAL domain-containing protein [Chloroflexota bacterium]